MAAKWSRDEYFTALKADLRHDIEEVILHEDNEEDAAEAKRNLVLLEKCHTIGDLCAWMGENQCYDVPSLVICLLSIVMKQTGEADREYDNIPMHWDT